jgi:DNA-binding PadR family transcriptional regulator
VEQMSDAFKKEIVQRITRNLLDIQILRLIQTQPMWGYMIKKQAETKFGVKLGHGALYPLLNVLEQKSFLTSQKQQQKGRTRKTYTITQKGKEYIDAYASILKEQIQKQDIKQRNQTVCENCA